ncbi:putative maltose permease mal31 [Phaeomoniella chlamydospora]|uniref:Putative maltose permease mal31 n=1 Tax=Phaeomoniella chlamydospora TaxID=158046 RepID=A0A0G2EHK4_PHACM|nr:putative maltose permease mal31 [Phaeomoniella chlamydospora]
MADTPKRSSSVVAPGKEDIVAGHTVTINAAVDITEKEHELGFWQAVKLYPKAVFWAAFFCIAVIMAGFDPQLITSFYALPAFQKKFGYLYDGEYIISAPWQTGLGMGNPIGQILGALACGWPLEKFGRKLTLAACCCWSIVWVFLQFFSQSLGALCAGEMLAGLAYGFYVVIAPTYASEVCPLALRGVLTASVNLAFVIGQFIAQGCSAGVESRSDQWAYKIPFALQWIWPVVLLIGLSFAPESPYWLVRQGRKEDARAALLSLSSAKHRPDIDAMLVMIEETDLLEREIEKSTSYIDCFRGTNLRRTEISIVVYLIQVIGGNPLIGYATYFFEQAGLDPSDAFNMGVGNTALGFVGTCISWPLMSKFGRRTIYNTGMVFMTTILFIIGFLDIGHRKTGAIWAQATLMDIWTFTYQMTVGPICFVIISEISSTRLRGRTIAIATAVQAIASIVFTIAMPYMLSSDQANWRGKAGFLFGAISLACLVWCFLRIPESRGRTFEEIDILFDRKVPARGFAKYDVLQEAQHHEEA